MTIDWVHFTPWSSLAGGALIGLASSIFLLFNGRITGISGLIGGLLTPRQPVSGVSLFFLAGLLAAPLLWALFAVLPAITFASGPFELITAGLLVGLGTRYGAGCTSGHAVCGLARLSGRSLVATLCFMAMGFATTFILKHSLEL